MQVNGKRKTVRKHWPRLQVCQFSLAHPPRRLRSHPRLQQVRLACRHF